MAAETQIVNKENSQNKDKSRPSSSNSKRSKGSANEKIHASKDETLGNEKRVPSPVQDALENPALDIRNMRRIIAEDPNWSLATVPLLTELCNKHIISNFENNSQIIKSLNSRQQSKILSEISTAIPLKVTSELVADESYWKRCCSARWKTDVCDVSRYGGSWKRMFFERLLEHIIEHFVPGTTDPAELNETLALAANFVLRLQIRQLLPPIKDALKPGVDDFSDGSDIGDEDDEPEIDHFDFAPVFAALPQLEELQLSYGVRDCGMNFDWSLFNFTARDCLLLAKCVAQCTNLRVLKLQRSKLDDDKTRVLISHLLDHPGLRLLDLSHNTIGDRGARALGKFINNHSRLEEMVLADNSIRAAGAQAIAHALTKNSDLATLNLRMNRLADEGGQAICRALLRNTTLRSVNLAANELSEPTAAVLSQVLSQNVTLKEIDLSCNRIGPDGGKQLQEGIEENKTLQQMDLRLTECGAESEYCINQALYNNRELTRKTTTTS